MGSGVILVCCGAAAWRKWAAHAARDAPAAPPGAKPGRRADGATRWLAGRRAFRALDETALPNAAWAAAAELEDEGPPAPPAAPTDSLKSHTGPGP